MKLLVEMLEPYRGRIYDGCCGSGGMFVQSEKAIEEHQGRLGDLSIYGQESNPTTLRLAKMNLAIRGIDARIELGDTLLQDKHPDLKADYILANPPFNISDWSGEHLRDDARWKYGIPPTGNAAYAWLQHFVAKLSPAGTAGIVLAAGSMNSNTGGEGEIRGSPHRRGSSGLHGEPARAALLQHGATGRLLAFGDFAAPFGPRYPLLSFCPTLRKVNAAKRISASIAGGLVV